jgi:phosphoglycerate kinase
MQIKSVRDAELQGKRVLVRVDFNVPLQNGAVVDDTRIKAALPTINVIKEKGAAKILLLTHLGRPEGKVVEELRTAPIATKLAELGVTGVEVLENIRFEAGEEANDPALAQKLAGMADVFVNDAFAAAHRAHASTVGVAKLLPSYAGLLMEEEVAKLSAALVPPQGAVAIIGGAKFETKQPLIEKLLERYSKVLLGGALGNDFIKARGHAIGASVTSAVPVPVPLASEARIVVATDVIVGEPGKDVERTALVNDIRAVEAIMDIGPNTAALWAREVGQAPFVVWNGPMGVYERGFTHGTEALASAIAGATTPAVVGGGDTIAALSRFPFDHSRVFLSTGGGAMLEFLTNGTLPALEVLKK